MYLTRAVCPIVQPTPKEYMTFLVGLNIGFKYDETNDYYVWQTENMDEPAPFYIDIMNHEKTNWNGGTINSSGNYKVYIFSKLSDTNLVQFESIGYNANYRFVFDYAIAGNNIFFNATNSGTAPTVFKNFFIAPVSETDPWFTNSAAYLWDSNADQMTMQVLGTAKDDGFTSMGGSVNCLRIGEWFDGYTQKFNDNLYIASVRPPLWEGGFGEYKVGDRTYFVWTHTNSSVGVCIDITDYIEEE